jgi:protease I
MKLQNQKILMFVADEYEDLELHYPRLRLVEEGAHVVIASATKKESFEGKHGYPCKADILIDKVNPKDYTALIIPGGYAPDKLRTEPKILEVVKQFHKAKKLIAFICHAGWIPISAGILKGVRCTSYKAIKDDMVNAGAKWVNEPVVVDGHFISSRFPDDLPHFCPAIIHYLEHYGQPSKKK